MAQKSLREMISYWQNDPDGPVDWMERHIKIAIPDPFTGIPRWTYLGDLPGEPHPITGKSWQDFWEWQKSEIIKPALEKGENGIYKYHTICLSTPRGQGKSYMCCFLILYRFFTMPRQKILLGSNSMGQAKFSMYETMQELIRNSPRLLAIIGPENIKEKEIRLVNARGEVTNIIRTISTSTGVLSNISALSFSEFFQQRPDAPFFHQLNSSRRGIVNSQAYIDSTVSSEDHTLHKLYESSFLRKNTNPGVFFYYDYSEKGDIRDYRLPSMTQAELDNFKDSMPPAEFRMLFLNRWEDGAGQLFSPKHIMAMKYIGVSGVLHNHQSIVDNCNRIKELEATQENDSLVDNTELINSFQRELIPLKYTLIENNLPKMMTVDEAKAICNEHDSDCAVIVGIDRADPLKSDTTEGARTMMTTILKLLPGSRLSPNMHLAGKEGDLVKYLYFVADVKHIETNELDDIKHHLDLILNRFGRINMLCSERWGMSEILTFLEDSEVDFELVSPTYAVQRSSFNTLYSLIRMGLIKCPKLAVPGFVKDDILDEELSVFRHDAIKKFYGSPSKKSKHKPQDDEVFSLALGIYGGRGLTPIDFEPMQDTQVWKGWFPESTMGRY